MRNKIGVHREELIELLGEAHEFRDKLRKLDALADEFVTASTRSHEEYLAGRGYDPPSAYSLAVRMKQIIGTYQYGPSPFKEREENT